MQHAGQGAEADAAADEAHGEGVRSRSRFSTMDGKLYWMATLVTWLAK